MNKLLLSLLALIALTPVVHADPASDPQGGNAVVCFDSAAWPTRLKDPSRQYLSKLIPNEALSHVKSVTLLDLYYSTQGIRGDKAKDYVKSQANQTETDYVNKIAGRFDPLSSSVRTMIEKGRNMFGTRITSFTEEEVSQFAAVYPTKDIHPLTTIPANCTFSAIAVQDEAGNDSVKKLFIDDRMLKRADADSQILLKLHEYVLAYLTSYAHQTDAGGAETLLSHLITQKETAADLVPALKTFGVDPRVDEQNPLPAMAQDISTTSQAAARLLRMREERALPGNQFLIDNLNRLPRARRFYFVVMRLDPNLGQTLFVNHTYQGSRGPETFTSSDIAAMEPIRQEYETHQQADHAQNVEKCKGELQDHGYYTEMEAAKTEIRRLGVATAAQDALIRELDSLDACNGKSEISHDASLRLEDWYFPISQ